MHELMEDPIYRAYMKKAPATPANPNPAWQLWVEQDNRWLTGTFHSYAQVWPVFVKHFRARTGDPTITSRRTFFAPPGEYYKVRVKLATPVWRVKEGQPVTHVIEERWRQTFTWPDAFAEWCGRCRRPVRFEPLFETHHALKRMPVVSDEENIRCPVCGIRRSAQPRLENMVRL